MNTDSESKYLLTDIYVDQKSNPLFNSLSKQTELSEPENAQELAFWCNITRKAMIGLTQ